MQASTHVALGFFSGKMESLSLAGVLSLSLRGNVLAPLPPPSPKIVYVNLECKCSFNWHLFLCCKDAALSLPMLSLSLSDFGGGRGEEIWELTSKRWRISYKI